MITFLAALAFAAPAPVADLDAQCHRLMAELAESDDPGVRLAGLTASLYFLGRLESRQGRAGDDAPAPTNPERTKLIRDCGQTMEDSGRDFGRIGEQLEASGRPQA